MKRVLLVLCVLCASSLSAQRIGKTLIHMEQLYRNGSMLQAMDSAAYVLSVESDNFVAKTFMYQHWDKTMADVQERIGRLTDENNLEQARERLLIYKQLDEIHTYLRAVPMPLRGPNDRWVWQPELGYYTGMYDTERVKTYDLVLRLAEDALQSYEVELARSYYDYALKNLFVTDGERKSNLKTMVAHVNGRIATVEKSDKVYELIVAYYLTDLSLWLDESQVEKIVQKQAIQQQISDKYLQLASVWEAKGDTIAAQENRLLAEDWKIYNDTIK